MNIKRGEIVLVNLEPSMGSEQGKIRPCLVVQNNVLNRFLTTTIVVPLTSRIPDKDYPSEVVVNPGESGLKEKSSILCHQIRAISFKDRILKKIGSLTPETMRKVNEALKTSLGIE